LSNDKTDPIGIFDSGIGGLTVVKKIDQYLPSENNIYFGDTARVPYGAKSNSTVIEYSIQDAQFLVNQNIKLLIVACNTASSVALNALKDKFDIPIIGMIEPGAQMALEKSKSGKIGVIGTYATINNKAYSNEIKKLDASAEVFEKACPLFVPLAEEGWTDHKATYAVAEEYLAELKQHKIDTLILGCTHYPILTKAIQDVVGDDVTLIDSGTAAARQVKKYLTENNYQNDSGKKSSDKFFVSDVPTKFIEVAQRFLGREINEISKIDLEEALAAN
jgi:glutamate racemase